MTLGIKFSVIISAVIFRLSPNRIAPVPIIRVYPTVSVIVLLFFHQNPSSGTHNTASKAVLKSFKKKEMQPSHAQSHVPSIIA